MGAYTENNSKLLQGLQLPHLNTQSTTRHPQDGRYRDMQPLLGTPNPKRIELMLLIYSAEHGNRPLYFVCGTERSHPSCSPRTLHPCVGCGRSAVIMSMELGPTFTPHARRHVVKVANPPPPFDFPALSLELRPQMLMHVVCVGIAAWCGKMEVCRPLG